MSVVAPECQLTSWLAQEVFAIHSSTVLSHQQPLVKVHAIAIRWSGVHIGYEVVNNSDQIHTVRLILMVLGSYMNDLLFGVLCLCGCLSIICSPR